MMRSSVLMPLLAALMVVLVTASEVPVEGAGAIPACLCSLDAVGSGVCGADGNTFANECLASCAGVAVVSQGACAVHASTNLFAAPTAAAASAPTLTPLSAELLNLYASEGFKLVGRADASAVVGPGTPPPAPTGSPTVDPTARYAALRLDVPTGLLYASNGSSIAEAAALGGATESADKRPARRPRGPRNRPTDLATQNDTITAGSIIGTDTRSQITWAPSFPYTAVVALQGSTWCSGSMINTHAVLTAGHCIYSSSGWIDRTRLIVAPGVYRTCSTCTPRYPCGTIVARSMTTYATYTSTFDPAYDMAVIRLDRDVGGCTGWFGMQANSGTFSGALNTAGYPGDKPSYSMFQTQQSSVADSTQDYFLAHPLDTAPGQSGSPLWNLINGVRQVRAVHAYGVGGSWTLNRGVAITTADFNNINAWGA